MDLLAIVRSVGRHRLLTIPILCLVALGVLYILAFTPTRYETTSSYVLFTPPPAPSVDDIKENPLLALVNADNPYARMDPSIVVSLVAKRVNSDSVRRDLEAKGADARYEVLTGGLYGSASPTVEVTGVGETAEAAIRTAEIVGAEFGRQLHAMQEIEGTDDAYMVKSVAVDGPESAQQKVSSRLRSVFGVLGLGALLVFVAVSIGEALDTLRREKAASLESSFLLPPPFVATTVPSPDARGGRSQDPSMRQSAGTSNGASGPNGARSRTFLESARLGGPWRTWR